MKEKEGKSVALTAEKVNSPEDAAAELEEDKNDGGIAETAGGPTENSKKRVRKPKKDLLSPKAGAEIEEKAQVEIPEKVLD
jgi:hypothetical protein